MRVLALVSGLIFLASFMATLGLRLTPGLLSAELARPGRLGRGLVLNLVLVPLATVLCLRALGVTGWVAAGLVALAVSPGAPLSPSSAKKAGGSPGYAIVLTVVLGIVTAFTAAPSARWLLSYEGDIGVRPPVIIAKLALLQWLPLAAGALQRRRSPERAAQLERVAMALVVVSGLLIVVGSIAPLVPHLSIVGWRGLSAVLVSMVAVVTLGWLSGGSDHELSRTFTATAGVPNIGLAMAMARAANAPRDLLLTIAACFLLRVFANQFLVQFLARAHGRPAEPFPVGSSAVRP